MLTHELSCILLLNYTLIWRKYNSEDTRFVGLGICAVAHIHSTQNCWFVTDNNHNYPEYMNLYFLKVFVVILFMSM
jgi:hypothetical protein